MDYIFKEIGFDVGMSEDGEFWTEFLRDNICFQRLVF